MLKVLASDDAGSAQFALFDKDVKKVIEHDTEIVVGLYMKV